MERRKETSFQRWCFRRKLDVLYRVGSTCAILSRAFCNADKMNNVSEIERLFETEMIKIREAEALAAQMSEKALNENHEQVRKLVGQIVAEM